MFSKIVVTLDGSTVAESVLPYVSELVRSLKPEELALLNVVEADGEGALRMADSYLEGCSSQLSQSWEKKGLSYPPIRWTSIKGSLGDVRLKSHVDEVAGEILRFTRDNGSDLIVMSTHGRTGADLWFMGSVAEKVIRGTEVPLFLVRADGDRDHPIIPTGLKSMLVALDGSPLAEQALPYVKQLASSTGMEITLIYVIPSPHGGSGAEEQSETDRAEGERYLTTVSSDLEGLGAKVSAKVRVGRPGQQITEEAKENPTDLVVMTSHGRARLTRWAMGSVAYQVLHNSPVPILMVRSVSE